MIELIPIFAAGAVGLFLSGVSLAADEKMQDPTSVTVMWDQGAPPIELSRQDQEYFLTLNKCEDMQDTEKQKCIEQAKQRYSSM
jgi:hypothetical protein